MGLPTGDREPIVPSSRRFAGSRLSQLSRLKSLFLEFGPSDITPPFDGLSPSLGYVPGYY